MGIKTVPHPPYSPDLAAYDFWLYPKLRGCRYETIETVTKVIDVLTQEDFHGAFQKLLEPYHKCIAAGGDYFVGGYSFMCLLSIKVSIQKKSGNIFNDPRNSIFKLGSSCYDELSFGNLAFSFLIIPPFSSCHSLRLCPRLCFFVYFDYLSHIWSSTFYRPVVDK